MKFFYAGTYGGVEYSPDDTAPILAYLRAHPDDRGVFEDTMIRNVRSLMSWGDYESAKEAFNTVCAVLAAHRRELGELVRE